ncbi:MAG TPA: cellulase family glycosylhydrolase, partial [Rhodothermales bacterium]
WRQIATRYKDRPDGLLFELMNEPHDQLTASKWNQILEQGIAAVRETNPTRNIVIGPTSWNNTDALSSLRLPDDEHIIVTVHMYEPFQFTHQGADWVDGSEAWRGRRWTGTPNERQFVTNILQRAVTWGQQNDRPIFLGEFGAYSAAEMESRALWTSHVAREAERLGLSWAYWEFMSGFGLYIPQNDTFREALKEALIPSESED